MDFGLNDYIGDEDYGNITIDELGKLLEDFSAEEPVRYLNRKIFSILAYVTSWAYKHHYFLQIIFNT